MPHSPFVLKYFLYLCTSFKNLKEAIGEQKTVLGYVPGHYCIIVINALQGILQDVRSKVECDFERCKG